MSDSVYTGLSDRARVGVLSVAAVIAVLNLMAAWYFAFSMGEHLRLTKDDMEPFSAWIAVSGGASASGEVRHDLAARAMHIVAIVKLVANKQGIVLACFGGAFALAAIGFALFVIGADGAFKISAQSSEKAKLVMSGTAPGLFCFLMCAGLIALGVQQKSAMQLPEVPVLGRLPESVSTPVSCVHTDANSKCYSEMQWSDLTGK